MRADGTSKTLQRNVLKTLVEPYFYLIGKLADMNVFPNVENKCTYWRTIFTTHRPYTLEG